MKHNQHKKQITNLKKLETSLINDLSPLMAQGTYYVSCLEKDVSNKAYKVAKKRYKDLLDHAQNTIKDIKSLIEELEKETIKANKKEKLIELDDKRNKKIRKEDEEEVPAHRKGWF